MRGEDRPGGEYVEEIKLHGRRVVAFHRSRSHLWSRLAAMGIRGKGVASDGAAAVPLKPGSDHFFRQFLGMCGASGTKIS